MEGELMKRSKMNKRSSKKYFKKTSDLSHAKNFKARPMRGGIRL
jgi:hypothetical protein